MSDKDIFYKIDKEFSTNYEYREFEENVGFYWDNLNLAQQCIEKWILEEKPYPFNGKDIKELEVCLVDNIWCDHYNKCQEDHANAILVKGIVVREKHNGYKHSTKEIVGPDGEKYSRPINKDLGYSDVDEYVKYFLEIERFKVNVGIK